MHDIELTSTSPPADRPRHPQQEIADLLAVALLRLRTRQTVRPDSCDPADNNTVGLGFFGHQRVNANHDHTKGVRP